MFRVAGVASLICDNFSIPIDKEMIINACLLHDLGNIVKFNFEIFPDDWYKPEGKKYWEKTQKEFIKKYGNIDHKVTVKILKELRVPNSISHLIGNMGFGKSDKICSLSDFNLKILAYADQRVTPYGIVSMEERYEEAAKRYSSQIKNKYSPEQFEFLKGKNFKTEKQIFSKCKIKPEDINEGKASLVIEKLKLIDIPTK
jgi:hypothetical protein